MSDRKDSVPFEGDDAAEQRLWAALNELPLETPPERLRRNFYHSLGRAGAPGGRQRLREWFGFSGNAGWLTAAVCVLLGLGVGQALDSSIPVETARIAALEEQLSAINRELIINRLQDATPGNRLRGVMEASSVAQNDAEIARALLARATQDRVTSVRSAAIDALGPSLDSPAVGTELMSQLEQADSPLVQLALVDLVLRHGNASQLGRLLQLASDDRLHPELNQHVLNSLGSESI